MTSEIDGYRIGLRLIVCLIISIGFFALFEPLFSYALGIISIEQSLFTLLTVISILTVMFYSFGYDELLVRKSVASK